MAHVRPRNWLEYCAAQPTRLLALVADLPTLLPEALVHALRLVLGAVRPIVPPTTPTASAHAATLIGALLTRASFLPRFIDTFLLRHARRCSAPGCCFDRCRWRSLNSAEVRMLARNVLHAVW